MWSFVKNQRKKQWLWIPLDQNTRKIVGLYIGDRSKNLPKSSRNLYLLSIDNVLFVILIFGNLLKKCYIL
ncbi:hypothetical protein [Microcoleus sp. S13_B4]|uniref:hypothetical protein n=1 Tax=Microcoleus sp. S13_B4 TaxID=3055408 RepID=UPI00403F6ED8